MSPSESRTRGTRGGQRHRRSVAVAQVDAATAKYFEGLYPDEPVTILLDVLEEEVKRWLAAEPDVPDCANADVLRRLLALRDGGAVEVEGAWSDALVWLPARPDGREGPVVHVTSGPDDIGPSISCEALFGDEAVSLPTSALRLKALPIADIPFAEKDLWAAVLLRTQCRASGVPLPGRTTLVTWEHIVPRSAAMEDLAGRLGDALRLAENVAELQALGVRFDVRYLDRVDPTILADDNVLSLLSAEVVAARQLWGAEEGATVNVFAERDGMCTGIWCSRSLSVALARATVDASRGRFPGPDAANVFIMDDCRRLKAKPPRP